MSSSPTPPVLTQDNSDKLTPPTRKFVLEAGSDADSELHPPLSHSRTTSGATSHVESPPVTPRSFLFNTQINPFSPPGSVSSFNSAADLTPAIAPGIHGPQHSVSHYPFPDVTSRSSVASRSTSIADLTRISSSQFGSRPSTADRGFPSFTRPSSARLREAFTSPPQRPLTMLSTLSPLATKIERERPKSTMLSARGPLQKPWIKERDPYARIAYFVTYTVMLLGVAAGFARCYTGWRGVPLLKGNLCLVLEENFDSEEDAFGANGTFFREVDMSGFGNGEFEMATASTNNSFVKDGFLYIAPTLTSDNLGEAAIENGFVYNITGCTYNITRGTSDTGTGNASTIFDAQAYYKACSAVSNSTTGSIINPVQSARLSTRVSANIKYGKVEVRAKIPTGDWLWPAIWMLPVNNTYGPWPLSGEIDIMESRGNGPSYPDQGTDWVRGSLNWGPVTWLNAVAKTFGSWHLRRGTFDTDFHTYALEWSEDFIRIYVDTRLQFLMPVLSLKESFWNRGEFPLVVQNGSEAVILTNPWVNGTKAAPFDQSFYLILDVAVGGTNGWFTDGAGGKPWLDGSPTAMADFWKERSQWLPTWPTNVEDRAMVVDSVKMWQQC